MLGLSKWEKLRKHVVRSLVTSRLILNREQLSVLLGVISHFKPKSKKTLMEALGKEIKMHEKMRDTYGKTFNAGPPNKMWVEIEERNCKLYKDIAQIVEKELPDFK